MGAHSAGRRVRAPGRWRRLNQAVEGVAVAGLIAAATFAGWVSWEPQPHSPGLDPRPPTAASRPAEAPVPPVAGAALPTRLPTQSAPAKRPAAKVTAPKTKAAAPMMKMVGPRRLPRQSRPPSPRPTSSGSRGSCS